MDLKRGRDVEEDTSIDINPKSVKYQRVNQDEKISENLVEPENKNYLDVPPTISPKLSLDSKSNELEFYCSICRSILINPVTLECGFFTKKMISKNDLVDRLFLGMTVANFVFQDGLSMVLEIVVVLQGVRGESLNAFLPETSD